jgi:carboxylesterase type B
VFTPAGGSASGHLAATGGELPVLFWIYGGVLVHGESDMYDGSLIARTDHVVVVTINYRLTAFGFLDVPGLGTSPLTASGNYGLLDQEAALRWVHDNITAFGGNPRRVTIAGESAGGWSMRALLTSPPATGLFAGAIMESGSCISRTRSQAQTIGLKFAKAVGCTDPATAAACLRGTPGAARPMCRASPPGRPTPAAG